MNKNKYLSHPTSKILSISNSSSNLNSGVNPNDNLNANPNCIGNSNKSSLGSNSNTAATQTPGIAPDAVNETTLINANRRLLSLFFKKKLTAGELLILQQLMSNNKFVVLTFADEITSEEELEQLAKGYLATQKTETDTMAGLENEGTAA